MATLAWISGRNICWTQTWYKRFFYGCYRSGGAGLFSVCAYPPDWPILAAWAYSLARNTAGPVVRMPYISAIAEFGISFCCSPLSELYPLAALRPMRSTAFWGWERRKVALTTAVIAQGAC